MGAAKYADEAGEPPLQGKPSMEPQGRSGRAMQEAPCRRGAQNHSNRSRFCPKSGHRPLGVQRLPIGRTTLMWVPGSPAAHALLVASRTCPTSSHQLRRRVAADFCLAAAADAKHCRRLAQRPAPEGCVPEAVIPAQWLGGRASPAERPGRQPSSQPPARSHRHSDVRTHGGTRRGARRPAAG
jgi:hypothetical protein